jgi:hypothetical protein
MLFTAMRGDLFFHKKRRAQGRAGGERLKRREFCSSSFWRMK